MRKTPTTPGNGWHAMAEKPPAEQHHGFTNYETWLIAAWIDNDQPLYCHWTAVAEEARTVDVADALREEMEDHSPTRDEGAVYSDLLNAALGRVNWIEIANHLKPEPTDNIE